MRFNSSFQVNLSHFRFNLDLIRKKINGQNIILMIKADAYGHGIVPMVEAAYSFGVKEFGCASLGEAIYLREQLPDLQTDIYVFSDLALEGNHSTEYAGLRIIPVISNMDDLRFYLRDEKFKHVPCCLKINTGMNRLGIDEKDLSEVISLFHSSGKKEIHHIMSHFANSSLQIKEDCMTSRQYKLFQEIKKRFKENNITVVNSSIANSGAIEQNFVFPTETHVRPGLVAYGVTALIPKMRNKFPWEGKVVSKLRTKIIDTFHLNKGDPVGYGATIVPRNCKMALIPLGYGDGLFRNLEKCKISFGHFSGTFFGRLNMDMTNIMLDVGFEDKVQKGSEAILWDFDNDSLLELSDGLNTIAYEVLCHLGQRVPREYLY